MNDNFDLTPATSATEQTPTADTTTVDTTTDTPARATLPKNYLVGGYYATTDKGLNEMKPSDFAAMLRDMKRAKKPTLPFEARQTAAAELLPRAIGLVHKKKAPSILTEFIKANLAAIKTDDDWSAFYRHMNAISGFLVLNTADK